MNLKKFGRKATHVEIRSALGARLSIVTLNTYLAMTADQLRATTVKAHDRAQVIERLARQRS